MKITDSKQIIDHIDHNGLNNQKNNLRICDRNRNAKNKINRLGGTSNYKGVCWSKPHKKWYSSIGINYKSKYLGLFTNEIDAAKAYDNAAKVYHGEFAHLNFK